MFVVIWEYDVHAGSEAEFTALYGDGGAWVSLFRQYAGYVGTELLRDTARTGRYVTIDRWTSSSAYDVFLTAAESHYAQIDARGDALTAAERCLGRFDIA